MQHSTVRGAYRVLAQGRYRFTQDYDSLKKVSKGIEPDNETVNKAYKRTVDSNDSIWDYYFKKIKELTGISPPESLVQKAYARCIEKGEFEDFVKLRDIFKVEPSSKVNLALKKYLASG